MQPKEQTKTLYNEESHRAQPESPRSEYSQLDYQNRRTRSDGIVYRSNIRENVIITQCDDLNQYSNKKQDVFMQRTKSLGDGFRACGKIRKIKKKKNVCDYRKNICGYITKKIIRQFVSPNYYEKVRQLCQVFNYDYNLTKLFYSNKIEHVTGPSHIPGLIVPENQNQVRFKSVFQSFFIWFLKQRYLRYLLLEGKMTDKRAYVQYKNNTLFSLVCATDESNSGNFVKVQQKLQEDKSVSQYQIPIKQQEQPIKHFQQNVTFHIPIAIRPNIIRHQQY